MRSSSYAAVPVLIGALLLAGCGSSSQTSPAGGVGPSSSSSPALPTTLTTPPPRDDPTDPPLTGRSRPITASGRVTVSDIENGCRVMRIQGQVYQLVGEEVGKLQDGQVVTVTGYADDTMATTCQMGVVFVVTKLATPAGS
jgi:hypothetical protein